MLGAQVVWEWKLAFVGKGLDYDKVPTKTKKNKEIKGNLEEDPINSCSLRGAFLWMDAVC